MLEAFLGIADNILIGGGMVFPFIKQSGGEIGQSLCLNEELDVVADFLFKANKSNTKTEMPEDCVVTDDIKNCSNISVSKIDKIFNKFKGVDIGPKTINL